MPVVGSKLEHQFDKEVMAVTHELFKTHPRFVHANGFMPRQLPRPIDAQKDSIRVA
jgi:hypothetical protein